ncbi:MAG: galactokinase [Desulfatibacillaceae bacterium]
MGVDPEKLARALERGASEASAPCRLDMGGTVDLPTFHYALRHVDPCTFNVALNMRTTVRISTYEKGMVKVSSKGFESVEYPLDEVPMVHAVGLMMAVAAWFRASGVHIEVESRSPPKSALGGSSVAAVAAIGAFSAALERMGDPAYTKKQTVLLGHTLESVCAGVPCGMQDHLAAVYGGVNAWHWPALPGEPPYVRRTVLSPNEHEWLEERLLLAYCGKQHESADVNATWVDRFLVGMDRPRWESMCRLTHNFVDAVAVRDTRAAIDAMERELAIRLEMTPEVLDRSMLSLIDAAWHNGCGARFAGAGGGGCVWAMGEPGEIAKTRAAWREIVDGIRDARLLEVGIDVEGLRAGS